MALDRDERHSLLAFPKGKRQQRETSRALEAYSVYEGLGVGRTLPRVIEHYQNQRKVTKTAKGYTPTIGVLKNWSAVFHWVERAAAYDEQQREEQRRKREQAIEVMDSEHAIYGRSMALKSIRQIDELIKLGKFNGQAAVQLFTAACSLERLARGSATERHIVSGEGGGPVAVQQEHLLVINPAALTLDELTALSQLARVVKEREDRSTL